MIYPVLVSFFLVVPATEAPLVGRPREHFYNAVGQQVRVELSATPTEVRVEDELTLTIQISGAVNSDQIERPDLRTVDEFAQRFHIDDLDEGNPKESPGGVRAFRYRLRPKNEQVHAIPPLLFRYYNPRYDYFPTTVSNSISLHVQPRMATESTGMAMQEPDFLFQIAAGPAMLAHQSPRSEWPQMLRAVFVPALFCGAWYVWWRYRHPDEAKLAHLRRSRAVRHALNQLDRIHESTGARLADAITQIMREYLQERWDLSANASTPSEIARYLQSCSVPTLLMEQTREFFAECDAHRFGPPTGNEGQLRDSARFLLVALEKSIADDKAATRKALALHAGLLALLILATSSALAATETDEGGLLRAEMFFFAGTAHRDNDTLARPIFRQSAEEFAQLRLQGANSAQLHLNEGNAWLLSGDRPGAILAYERGLHLSPDDHALKQAIEYARSRVEYATPEDRQALAPREESLHWLRATLRQWGIWLIAGASAAGWLALTRWRVTRERSWAWAAGALLAIALAAFAGREAEFQLRQEDSRNSLGVVRHPALLRKGDGPSFAPRRDNPLPAGVEVTIRQDRGDWLQVKLADGSLGWLSRDAVERE